MRQTLAALALLAAGALCAGPAVADESAPNRLSVRRTLTTEAVSWADSDGRFVSFGSGRSWNVMTLSDGTVLAGEAPAEIRSGVLAGRRLYLDTTEGLGVVDFGTTPDTVTPLDLDFGSDTGRLLTRALEYLLVWRQGAGLQSVRLPPPPGHVAPQGKSHCDVWPTTPTAAGFAPEPSLATALAASGRRIAAALSTGEVALFDLDDEGVPHASGRISGAGAARAIAMDGARLYMLGDEALRVVDLDVIAGVASPAIVYRGVQGRALAVAGRDVIVGSDAGVTLGREPLAPSATFTVTATGFEFIPDTITINVGDTVQWNNVSGTHNVQSCNIGETGCTANSRETFTSGAPAPAPWTYSRTFTLVGANPYTCSLHAAFGMIGTVNVTAPSSPPPAVPKGSATQSPVRVRKTTSNGSTLEVSFDAASCTGIGGTQIVGGGNADLPTSPGGTYSVSASRCACGTTSPCLWTNSPLPAPGQMLWFVMVARDTATTEGSWGTDSKGNERNGSGPGGSSGVCGSAAKNVTNRCGT